MHIEKIWKFLFHYKIAISSTKRMQNVFVNDHHIKKWELYSSMQKCMGNKL